MFDPSITEIGVGGAVAVLVLDRAHSLIRTVLDKRNGNGNGNGKHTLPPEHWEARFDGLAQIGKQQTDILERIAANGEDMHLDIVRVLERIPK